MNNSQISFAQKRQAFGICDLYIACHFVEAMDDELYYVVCKQTSFDPMSPPPTFHYFDSSKRKQISRSTPCPCFKILNALCRLYQTNV